MILLEKLKLYAEILLRLIYNIGEYFYYKFKRNNEGTVWGYGIYTDD